MNKLLIKIPTRERGFDWLDSYLDNITNPNTRILLSLDRGSDFCELWSKEIEREEIIYARLSSLSNGKIEAINRDINEYLKEVNDFDVLLVGSDDMKPLVKGFDQIILDDMNDLYPDGDGCLWYHTEDHQTELFKRYKRHITAGSPEFLNKWICMMPVMGKAYYKRFNYVYHPSYKSFWCDNEQTAQAVKLKKITYLHKQIIKHVHPAWDKGGVDDELYSRNNINWAHDQNNFRKRQSRGFPIN